MSGYRELLNRIVKNPYHRMGAIAVFIIFAAMHSGYMAVRAFAPDGTRGRLLAVAAFFAAVAGAVAAALGARYQRKLDRLSQERPDPDELAKPHDEFFQLNQRVSGMARDLEVRVREMQLEKARLDAMLRSMQEGLIVIDEGRGVLLINPAACSMLKCAAERSIGRSLRETARNAELERLIDQTFTEDRPVSREIRFFNPDERYLLVNAAPCRIESGERQAALVFHDVTELHRLENMRREFVANVSHELKTPLTSLQGFIETLLAGAWRKPDHVKRFLDMMDEDAKRLSRLIHDLLDLSRIESEDTAPVRQPMDPSDAAEKALSGLATAIAHKALHIDNQLAAGAFVVMADPGQLEQVWVNLLENAVKFTPPGGRIEVRSSRDAASVRFEISDSGSGIPEAALPRVFERFYRVDPARSREMGGTGLGLSIVKHIVEQHGGSVGVTSAGPGLGSTFFFSLPTA